jgi:adenylate kinase family enzyme
MIIRERRRRIKVSMAYFRRTVIVGNGGSGKSWLAEQLSRRLSVPDLDVIHWEPGGYNVMRDKSLAIEMARQAAEGQGWVIEGVYGWLAREALPRATALIWLDIDDDECIANLKRRGLRRGGDETAFAALLTWAGEYRARDNANSFAGHERIFRAFPDSKAVLRSRSDMAEFLKRIDAARAY